MSIQSEINRIRAATSEAYTAASEKGATMPSVLSIANLAETIRSIPSEGSSVGYTNQIPISTDTDGSIFNGTGYMEKRRMNSSGAVANLDYSDCAIPPFVTGFIPAATGAVIRLKNCYIDAGYAETDSSKSKYGSGSWGIRNGLYNSSKTKVAVASWGDFYDGNTAVFSNHVKDSNGHITQFTVAQSGVSFVRLCLAPDGDPANAIVTVNEEIIDEVLPLAIVKLWENSSPTSAFAAQTVSLDLSQYDGISIYFKNKNNSTVFLSTGIIPVGHDFTLFYMTSDPASQRRAGSVSKTGVTFATGYGGSAESTACAIPVIIYGYQGIT